MAAAAMILGSSKLQVPCWWTLFGKQDEQLSHAPEAMYKVYVHCTCMSWQTGLLGDYAGSQALPGAQPQCLDIQATCC